VEENLTNVVPPGVCVFSVFVRVKATSVDVDLPTEIDETADSFEETGIGGRAVSVLKNLQFLGLARGDIHDTNFMRVNDRCTVKVSEEGRKGRLVDDSTMSWGARIRRELEWQERRVYHNLFSALGGSRPTPDITCNGVGSGEGRSIVRGRDEVSDFIVVISHLYRLLRWIRLLCFGRLSLH
jgi:hypothetical protein